jgi:hypothetical protein
MGVRAIFNDDDFLRDCTVTAKSVEDFLKRYHVRDRMYREEFDILVKSYKEDVEKYGRTILPSHISVTGKLVAYFPNKGKE